MGARRRGWAAVLLAGATGVTGVGSVLWFTALPAAAFAAPVEVQDRSFNPNVTPIEVDDRVIWRNRDDEAHSVTSDSGPERFDYTLGTKGATEERKFRTAGTYTYHCRFHPQMTGTIEVVDPSAPTTTTSTAPPTTTSTAPPATTSTAPITTTTTEPPATSTTATTAPPTTTTTEGRPPAAVPLPPVPSSAPAPPPTRATSSTTTVPSSTTTTVPPTTATSAPPAVAGDAGAPPGTAPASPPSTEAAPAPDPGGDIPTAAGRPTAVGGELDVATVTLISVLVAVGLFAAWTLIRVRPGRI